MPLQLSGSVTLCINGEREENLRIDASDFSHEESGIRVLGDECTRHEFIYKYAEDPRFELLLTSFVINGTVKSVELTIEVRENIEVREQTNTIEAVFKHDPDQDDEPLTPVSSN